MKILRNIVCLMLVAAIVGSASAGEEEKKARKKKKTGRTPTATQRLVAKIELTDEQKTILQQRGVLSPEEIHRLASKTRQGMQADQGQAVCHSDVTDSDRAQVLQIVELGMEED